MSYDYIIVGAGSAGSVLADRLSADPKNNVLIIEAGGPDKGPMFKVPKGFAFTLSNPNFTYVYPTTPFGPFNQTEYWMRGKVLGGSSSVNGLVYNRGSQADYDRIEELGNPGWGWSEMLRVFKTIENHELGSSDMRGSGGPLGISVNQQIDELSEEIKDAGSAIGLKKLDDVNSSDEDRIGNTPGTIHKGQRVSAARAFLHPALKRANLTLHTGTTATGLIFEGERVVGVKAKTASGNVEFRASREVILSLGSIATPQLLQLSGIGPKEVLSEVGIDIRVASERVGDGIREHRCIPLQARVNRKIGYNHRLSSKLAQGKEAVKYLATRQGPIATPAYNMVAFLRTSAESVRPDGQILLAPFSMGAETGAADLETKAGISLLGFALRPTTESRVRLTSKDPFALPQVEAHYLETDYDRQVSVNLFRKMRELVAASPLAEDISHELMPGRLVEDDESILRSAFLNGGTGYHASGACSMGPDETDVIDSRLRVRGVQGLRVVDVSILPTMVSGNLNGPMMAMAWRASEMILQDR